MSWGIESIRQKLSTNLGVIERREFPNLPSYFVMLPAPENLSTAAVKVWTARGYGVWPSEKIKESHLLFTINPEQVSLLKSYIASQLIQNDAELCGAMDTKDKRRQGYREVAVDNDIRLNLREQMVKDLIASNFRNGDGGEITNSILANLRDASCVIVNYAPQPRMLYNEKLDHIAEVLMRKLGKVSEINLNHLRTRNVML